MDAGMQRCHDEARVSRAAGPFGLGDHAPFAGPTLTCRPGEILAASCRAPRGFRFSLGLRQFTFDLGNEPVVFGQAKHITTEPKRPRYIERWALAPLARSVEAEVAVRRHFVCGPWQRHCVPRCSLLRVWLQEAIMHFGAGMLDRNWRRGSTKKVCIPCNVGMAIRFTKETQQGQETWPGECEVPPSRQGWG